jgi:CheY-like chemotaxis protein
VGNGSEAMAFLKHEGTYKNAPRLNLVLLDLNLPIMDGREFLALVKSDPSLSSIPTIILTASDAKEDVEYCYQHHAYQSGEIDRSGRISRCGDEMMRVMLYEAAPSMLRSAKWSWLKAWAMQIAMRRALKKAIVALARRLAVITASGLTGPRSAGPGKS